MRIETLIWSAPEQPVICFAGMKSEDLRRFAGPLPDQNVVVNDDGVAMQIALFFGLADKLSDPKTPGPCTIWQIAENHPTHWIAFIRAWRHEDPSDNGWSMFATPKAAGSLEELKRDLAKGVGQ